MALMSRVTAASLQAEFADAGRDSYSADAYAAIVDYYEELGEDVELDVVAICGEWEELGSRELIETYTDYTAVENEGNIFVIDFSESAFIDLEDVIREVSNSRALIELSNGSYLVGE